MRPKEKLIADIMLQVFRVNSRLLEKGDQLVAGLGLTSARWQVLGAIALAKSAQTAPQIAEAMGNTRQGVQKQLNLLLEEGFLTREPNPCHERSPLYALTPKGEQAFSAADALCDQWALELAGELAISDIQSALSVLSALAENLIARRPKVREI